MQTANPVRTTLITAIALAMTLPGVMAAAKDKPALATSVTERYQWHSMYTAKQVGGAKNLTVETVEIKSDGRHLAMLGKGKQGAMTIPLVTGGLEMYIEGYGSQDIEIIINPMVKQTEYAGLRFTAPCVVAIEMDGTVLADKEGIVANDPQGKSWTSRATMLNDKRVIAFFPADSAARTWTDRLGRTVDADFLALENGKVKIKRKSDGGIFDFPLEKLSDADQAFVKTKRQKVSGSDSKQVELPSQTSQVAPKETFQTTSHWPTLTGDLSGRLEVRVKNPNDFNVRVGLRSGSMGKDFDVPANGTRSVYVTDGRYEIYFRYSSDPDSLYQGDGFSLSNGRGVEIQIVKVVNGNYGIRKVK